MWLYPIKISYCESYGTTRVPVCAVVHDSSEKSYPPVPSEALRSNDYII